MANTDFEGGENGRGWGGSIFWLSKLHMGGLFWAPGRPLRGEKKKPTFYKIGGVYKRKTAFSMGQIKINKPHIQKLTSDLYGTTTPV